MGWDFSFLDMHEADASHNAVQCSSANENWQLFSL